jgi:WD40 repeat protein
VFGSPSMAEMFSNYVMGQRRQPPVFSPDGRLVAAWSSKGVKLWDAATGEEIHTLKDFKGKLGAVAFSPDGRILAAAITKFSFKNNRPDFRSEVRTWEVSSGVIRQVVPLTTQSVSSLVFAMNGQQLIIGGTRRDETRSAATLELADLQSGSLGILQAREDGSASSIVLSPNGLMVAFQTDLTDVHLIDTQNWRIKQTLNESSAGETNSTIGRRFLLSVKSVMALAFASDGRTVSGEMERGGIRVWDTRTGELKKQLADQIETGAMAATSVDGSILAELSSDDETLRVWNLSTGEKKDFSVTGGPVYAIAVSPDGQSVAVSKPGKITLRNTASGVETEKLPVEEKVDWLSFSDDNLMLSSAGEAGTIHIWNLASGQIAKTISAGAKVTALRFGPGGRTLATAGSDGSVIIWDLLSGAVSVQLKKHSSAVNAIVFSSNGALMATGGDDRTVIIWDVATGKARKTLKGHDLAVTSLAFSRDASLIASGAGNASVVLWDVASGKLNRVLR